MNLLLFLGAGFSVEAGLPTQNHFLDRVFQLSTISQNQKNAVSAAYYTATYHEGKKKITMEEAFCNLDFIYMINNDYYKIAYLKDIIRETGFVPSKNGISIGNARSGFIEVLEKIFDYNRQSCRTYNCRRGEYINQGLYDDFFKKLINLHEFAIITTNYDLICETSLEYIRGGKSILFPEIDVHAKDYKISGTYIPAPLLKLHGSIDWKETRADLPNITPPTFIKQFQRAGKFKKIWKEAEKAIKVSDTILFIGYSLPEIDTFVRYLIKAGLQPIGDDHKKKNIYIVKRSWTYKDEKNYSFIKNSKMVGHFEPLNMSFREFAKSNIYSIIE